MQIFNNQNFTAICTQLAAKDKQLAGILKKYGFPPMWTRPATFQTLMLIILEQQVSLASAFAAFKKLQEKIGYVTPKKILLLSDEDLRSCYFSRQKIIYARELATSITTKKLVLSRLTSQDDDTIRTALKKIKGIGDWTVDVYLMHALQRTDLFPLGDIALVNSLKEVKNLPKDCNAATMLAIAEKWRPHRTIAAMILWHAYIKKRNIKIMS